MATETVLDLEALDLAPFDGEPWAPASVPGPPPERPPYVHPSPTGWRSSGRRRGIDPGFSSGVRRAGGTGR